MLRACVASSQSFQVGSFHTRREDWRKKSLQVSEDADGQIISAAAVRRIYTWRTIASLEEALRGGVEEDSVQFAWKALLVAIKVFKTTIHPLLANCERQLHFLGQFDRLNWYDIVS
jgi:hypothetical protein